MAIGETLPSEVREYQDHQTGTRIRQLTNCRTHSHHPYFTTSGLWDGGRQMLIASDRGNARNIYSVAMDSGELTQITDFGPEEHPRLQTLYINPTRPEVYFLNDNTMYAVDLHTRERRELYRPPEGYNAMSFSCTADGSQLCMSIGEDLSSKIHMDLGHGYVGFHEYSAARPDCRIVAIPTTGGEARTVFQEAFWLNHVNASTALPDVLTYCHEGPWDTIDQRMWRLEISTGHTQPLRPQSPGETIGHEYWFADGQRIGYHGTRPATDADAPETIGPRGVHLFGYISHDNTGQREVDFPHGSYHFHSIDETLIVGDGGAEHPCLLLWRLGDGQYEGPRKLLTHRGSWHVQYLHVHPRMFRDAAGETKVLYTADPQGYGQVYIADVPDFDSLPPLEEK